MAMVMEFKGEHGGTIRIFDDYLPKTPEEEARNRAQVQRAVVRCLTETVQKYGVEETKRMIQESPYAPKD